MEGTYPQSRQETKVGKRACSMLPIQWIINNRCADQVFSKSIKTILDQNWMFVNWPEGFIISRFWLMISIWRGREQMRWLANYRGFTISRFLPPPRVPPPVNQLWMIARHKSWIEMSDRKSLFQMMPWKMWKFESVKLSWSHLWWLISEPICP